MSSETLNKLEGIKNEVILVKPQEASSVDSLVKLEDITASSPPSKPQKHKANRAMADAGALLPAGRRRFARTVWHRSVHPRAARRHAQRPYSGPGPSSDSPLKPGVNLTLFDPVTPWTPKFGSFVWDRSFGRFLLGKKLARTEPFRGLKARRKRRCELERSRDVEYSLRTTTECTAVP